MSHVNNYYVDRGDPLEHDFTKEDLITDLQWHDLDLSNIIPEGTNLVHMRVRINASELGGLQFRKKGNINNLNVTVMKIQVSNVFYYEDFFVSCDYDRKIQYLASNITWTNIDILVRGWFTRK